MLLLQQKIDNINESVFKSFPGVHQSWKKCTFTEVTVQIVRYIEWIDIEPTE